MEVATDKGKAEDEVKFFFINSTVDYINTNDKN